MEGRKGIKEKKKEGYNGWKEGYKGRKEGSKDMKEEYTMKEGRV